WFYVESCNWHVLSFASKYAFSGKWAYIFGKRGELHPLSAGHKRLYQVLPKRRGRPSVHFALHRFIGFGFSSKYDKRRNLYLPKYFKKPRRKTSSFIRMQPNGDDCRTSRRKGQQWF